MLFEAMHPNDLSWGVQRLPKIVFELLKQHPGKLFVAGGFIRATVANEPINDIDLFACSPELALKIKQQLESTLGVEAFVTDNAYTLKTDTYPIQIIHRWTFDSPARAMESFDFTIARAAIYCQGQTWHGLCDPLFYQDLAAKRLTYTRPFRNEDAGGSILRVLKFYQRGYRIPLYSLAAVIARFTKGIDTASETKLADTLYPMLREVDPQVDPTHEAH